jgi:hypothetical protein
VHLLIFIVMVLIKRKAQKIEYLEKEIFFTGAKAADRIGCVFSMEER